MQVSQPLPLRPLQALDRERSLELLERLPGTIEAPLLLRGLNGSEVKKAAEKLDLKNIALPDSRGENEGKCHIDPKGDGVSFNHIHTIHHTTIGRGLAIFLSNVLLPLERGPNFVSEELKPEKLVFLQHYNSLMKEYYGSVFGAVDKHSAHRLCKKSRNRQLFVDLSRYTVHPDMVAYATQYSEGDTIVFRHDLPHAFESTTNYRSSTAYYNFVPLN
jgi:hypothetical protein